MREIASSQLSHCCITLATGHWRCQWNFTEDNIRRRHPPVVPSPCFESATHIQFHSHLLTSCLQKSSFKTAFKIFDIKTEYCLLLQNFIDTFTGHHEQKLGVSWVYLLRVIPPSSSSAQLWIIQSWFTSADISDPGSWPSPDTEVTPADSFIPLLVTSSELWELWRVQL